MAHKLIIIADATIAGPRYGTGVIHASVLLSAGIEIDSGLPAAPFDWLRQVQPWNWDSVEGFRLAYRKKMQVSVPLPTPNPVPIALPWHVDPTIYRVGAAPSLGDLAARLAAHAEWIVRQSGIENAVFDIRSEGERYWLPGFIADVSRWPAPIGRAANAAFVIELPVKIDGISLLDFDLILCPVLWVDRQRLDPMDTGPSADGTEWAYATPAEALCRAQAAFVPYTKTGQQLIDLQSQWVVRPPKKDSELAWYGRDYWLELPHRVAAALDPLTSMVGIWRLALKNGGAALKAWLASSAGQRATFETFAKAATDSLLCSSYPAADDYSLVQLVLKLQAEASSKLGQPAPDPAAIQAFANAVEAVERARAWPSLLPALKIVLDADSAKFLEQSLAPDVATLISAGERLLQALESRDKAAAFTIALWEAAAKGSGGVRHLEDMKRHPSLAVAAALQQVDARRRLLLAAGKDDLDHLPPVRLWENDARTRFTDAMAERIRAKVSFPAAAEASELRDLANAYARTAGERILPPKPTTDASEAWQQQLGDPSPTDAPHNLSFQIDWVANAKEAEAQKAIDILRKVAGFGVLLRPAASDADLADPGGKFLPWRCLNMATCAIADASFQPNDPGPLSNPLLVKNLLVPKVVGYGAGISQSTITYDNAGLIAQDSDTEFDGVLGHADEHGRPLLRYITARDSSDAIVEWGKLPYLRFGQVYEAATFVVLNGGPLPKELAAGDPSTFLAQPTDLSVDPPSGTVQRMRYVRRVRVNEPTVRGVSSPRQLAPTVPSTNGALRPIADSLDPLGRPAGLDRDHAHAAYFVVDNGGRGTLDLARDASEIPSAASEIGLRVLAIDTSSLGTGGLEIQVVKPNGSGGTDKLFALVVTRANQTVTCSPSGANEPLSLTLPGAVGDPDSPLIDVILNPVGMNRGWRLALGVTGRPFDHIDPARTGSLAAFREITVPATLKDGIQQNRPVWNSVGIRVELTGAAQRVSYGRPAVRIGSSWQGPEPAADPPLMLLEPSDAAKKVALVRLPSVDMLTFDRWVAMDDFRPNDHPTPRTQRLAKWRIKAIVGHEEIVQSGAEVDASFDDPAVEQTMLAELVPVMSPGDKPPIGVKPIRKEVTLELPDEPNPNDPYRRALECIRCAPLVLTIERGASASLTPRSTPAGLTVSVPEGQIWELRLYPLVHEKWFYPARGSSLPRNLVARFPDLVRDGLPVWSRSGATYVCTAPLRLRIETAAVMEIAGDVLAAMVTTRFASPRIEGEWGLDGYEMPLSKMPDAAMARKIWDTRYDLARVGAVDLYHQQWRWDGMLPPPVGVPPSGWPLRSDRLDFDFPFDSDANQEEWAAVNFARRDLNDFVREPRVAVGLPFVRTSLYRRDIGGDSRASVHRFAAAAVDRYEPIAPNSRPVWAGGPASSVTPPFFKLLLVPCRRFEPVPKPAFKLIVPLTRAADGTEGEPGLLVVLSESWGEIGGVAEALEWRVETASNDDFTLQEAGPEPALHAVSFAGSSADIIGGHRYELRFDGRGPIGHSYDSALGSVQQIVSTSFVLEPKLLVDGQSVTEEGKRKLPWSFAKIALRRVLIAGGVEGASSRDPATFVSKWTVGEWHQMLPDASRFLIAERGRAPARDAKPLDVSLPRFDLRFAQDGLHLVDKEDGGKDIVPWPAVSAGNVAFGLVMLVTERVFDAAGRRNTERYRALLEWDGTRLAPIDGTLPDKAAQNAVVVRLVEVQWLAKAASIGAYPRVKVDKSFWEDLIPPKREAETKTRIVRISRPVGSGKR